jgi:import receptor subunit TOM22
MVILTEVEDEHFQGSQPGPIEDDADYSDTDSEISNDSDFDPSEESLTERLYALRDIVPPTTRGWISNKFNTVSSAAWSVLSFSGKSAWVLSTSAIFIGVPFAIAWSEEQQVAAMEQEYNMRQQGTDLMTAGAGDEAAADKLAAALGPETQAKPAL